MVTRYVNTNSTAGGDGTTNNITGANRAYASLSAWETARDRDLVAADEIEEVIVNGSNADTTPTAVDGWTTGPNNYIVIKTTASGRHTGIWNSGKYRLEVADTGITIAEENVRVDGLQIKLTSIIGNGQAGVGVYPPPGVLDIRVSNNIIVGAADSTYLHSGIQNYMSGAAGSVMRIWNNIIYDVSGVTGVGIYLEEADVTALVYNNTAYNCGTGYAQFAGTIVAKNNIAYNNTENYAGTFASSSTNNLSGPSQTNAPGGSARNARTVTFVNAGSGDFRLASNDAGARIWGVPLSTDTSLAFSDDIESETRTDRWSIGADEQNAPGTMVTRYVNTNSTAGGDGTTNNITGTNRAYASLSEWETARDRDLVTVNEIEEVIVNGTNADTTATAINGWTTGPDNYILIKTTASGRHNGVWDSGKYRMEVANNDAISIVEAYVRIEGLQARVTATNAGQQQPIQVNTGETGAADIRISHNLIRGITNSAYDHSGIDVYDAGGAGSTVRIWNNIIYDLNGTQYHAGMYLRDADATNLVYNNTIYGCEYGYYQSAGTAVMKNNLTYNNTDNYLGTFASSSTNNLSGPGTDAQIPSSGKRDGVTVAFADAAGGNYHLSSLDAGARGWGADLSADTSLAFDADVDSATRTAPWDIGADQYSPPTVVTRYVNTNSTAGGDGTTNNTTGANRAYASLSAWEAARNRDLVAANEVEEVIVNGSNADTTEVIVDGWTTGSDNYILIKTTASGRHSGTWNTSLYRLETANTTALDIKEDNVRIDGLQAGFSAVDAEGINAVWLASVGTLNVYVSNCVLRGVSSAWTYKCGILVWAWPDAAAGGKVYLWNNIIYDIIGGGDDDGIQIDSPNVQPFIYNNTAYGCTHGYHIWGGSTSTVKNNIARSCTDGFVLDGALGSQSDYNSSGISGDAPVSAPRNNTASPWYSGATTDANLFTNAASDDFHLKAGSILSNAGQNLSSDGDLPFSTDADGQTRSSPWDVGADESDGGSGDFGDFFLLFD